MIKRVIAIALLVLPVPAAAQTSLVRAGYNAFNVEQGVMQLSTVARGEASLASLLLTHPRLVGDPNVQEVISAARANALNLEHELLAGDTALLRLLRPHATIGCAGPSCLLQLQVDIETVARKAVDAEWIQQQRWFAGKAREVRSVTTKETIALGENEIRLVEVSYADGPAELYVVPRNDETIGEALLAVLDGGAGGGVALQGAKTSLYSELRGTGPLTARVLGAEQSNTSIVLGDRLILKVIRRPEAGVNPDVEVVTFLTEAGFKNTPPAAGSIDYEGQTIAVIGQFVKNQGDAWKFTKAQIAAGQFDAAATDARLLGKRTAEMHRVLATGKTEAFAPRPFTAADLNALIDSVRERLGSTMILLRERMNTLAPVDAELASSVLNREGEILARLEAMRTMNVSGLQTRVHGDYHLGQVLRTENDFQIIDFEGEPARTLAERRAMSSPLKDVAGMLRSYAYAAAPDPVRQAYLAGYLDAMQGAEVLPGTPQQVQKVLDLYLLDKTVYELAYELNNRPDWIAIPLRGLAQ